MPAASRLLAAPGLQDPAAQSEVACHYTFMHENLFDMNHQFMHRKQMGSIRAKCIGRQHGDNWAQVEYTFSRTEGKASVGEQVIVDLVRKRGEARKDFSRSHANSHRLPGPEPQGLGGARHPAERRSGARCVARIHTAGCRAAYQPHLRLPVGQEAAAFPG